MPTDKDQQADEQFVVVVNGQRASGAMSESDANVEAQKRQKVQEGQEGQAPTVAVKRQLNG